MTDVQLYLALGIPFLSIVTAMVISTSRINDMRDLLRADIQSIRAETQGEFKAVHADLAEQRRLIDRIAAALTPSPARS